MFSPIGFGWSPIQIYVGLKRCISLRITTALFVKAGDPTPLFAQRVKDRSPEVPRSTPLSTGSVHPLAEQLPWLPHSSAKALWGGTKITKHTLKRVPIARAMTV